MLGKIEYDVEVPDKSKQVSEMAQMFRGFMADNTHKSVSIDYGERTRGAEKAYSSIRKIVVRDNEDVTLNVRGNVLYITKNNFDPEKIVKSEVIVKKKKRGSPPKKKDVDAQSVHADWMNGDTIADIAENNGITEAEVRSLLKSR